MEGNDAKELLELAETISLLGTWEIDLKTNEVFWSDGSFKICGYQPNEFEITLESGLAIIHPEDRSLAVEKINDAIEKGIPYEIRKRFITKDNQIIHIFSKAILIKDNEGKSIKLCGVFQDITSVVKLEEEYKSAINDLKSRNEFIETIVQHLPVGIAVNKISTGEATMVNSSFASIYGWTDKDLSDIESFFEKVYPDKTYRKEIMSKVLSDIASGDPALMNWENIIITTSKSEKRFINAKNIPVFDQDLMISTVVDVTERVNAAEKYKYLFQNNPAIMIMFDFETLQIVDFNDAALQKYGYSRNEFSSLNLKDLRPLEDVPLLDVMFTDEPTYFKFLESPIRNQKKNGDIFYVKISSHLLDYENRKCSLVQVIDVTQQLLAEENLKKSEENYKQIFKDNPGPMIIWDFETKNIVDCNDEALHQYGYTREEFLKLNIFDIRPQEDIELIKETTKDEKSYGLTHRNIWRHQKKNGELIYVNATGHIIDYNDRRSSLVMLIDMTKQIEAETQVRESEKKYRSFFENSMDGILLTNPDGAILGANPAACEIFQMTELEIIEKGRLGLVDQNDYRLNQLLNERETNGRARSEITMIKKDGTKFEGEIASLMFKDSQDKKMTNTIVRDITQQKNTEANLKEALLEKNEILESIGDAFFAINREWTVTYWNNQAEKMLGISKKEIIGHYLWNVFPDRFDSEIYIKYHEAMTDQNLIRFENYFEKLQSWYEVSIYPSNSGLSIYLKDISERVAYTKAIEERNIKLREIAYTQSHIVRAPLARILGIVNLIDELKASTSEGKELLGYLNASAKELDNVIKEIVSKTEDI
nr:PAS domain S-box protein [Pseudopedobacter sp.]